MTIIKYFGMVCALCVGMVVFAADSSAVTTDSAAEVQQNSEVTNKTEDAVESNLVITDHWMRAAIAGKNTAAYMAIDNKSSKEYVLVGASVDECISDTAELHAYKTDDKGVQHMHSVDNMVIPAKTTVHLKPGGQHLMIMHLKEDIVVGQEYVITLTFKENNTEKLVEKEVVCAARHTVKKKKKTVKTETHQHNDGDKHEASSSEPSPK